MLLSSTYPPFKHLIGRLATSISTYNIKLLKAIFFPLSFDLFFNALTRSFCYRGSRLAITMFPRAQRLSDLSSIRATRATEGWSTNTNKKNVRFHCTSQPI